MEGTQYVTKEAVLKRGREAIGIPLKDSTIAIQKAIYRLKNPAFLICFTI